MDLFYKLFKFGAVGMAGMAVDYTITFLCKEVLKIQKYMANALGFAVAASFNYYLNRIWTFNSQNQAVLGEYSSFILVSLIGLAINTSILWIFTSKLKWNFYLAKLIAIGITVFWNFFGNMMFTFE
ncbi:MAG TPA: GtrA family protein [Bacteroidales bacterium]|nr:GtrA family protein [Bacteroidales bacterium]